MNDQTNDPSPRFARAYAGDFEAHVTAFAPDAEALARFREWCLERRCKCVCIVLARGEHARQPMATWRRRAATLAEVVAEAEGRAAELARAGVAVARVKVEAAPFNADVPPDDEAAAAHPAANYFEHHAKLLRDRGAPPGAELLGSCERLGAHLSRNAFRDAEGGREERFVTLRCYRVGRATAERRFAELLAELDRFGERVVEHESEYCVYDSNLSLDAGWLAAQG